ncbi:right-handed parallel beta-helix repeat-containing protein, partial [Candidatus Micrarchaeota archaeon]|nr:right-handed parallel beta-helix repeat-containing protein [Candidatus Micrarchaeota archaeon]
SSGASSYAFIALSNWTGLGSNYEVFVDDGNTSDYIATRPTNDTSGKFRITRVGSNFSFFTWNSTASSWIYENSSNLNMSNALFFAFESESAYPGWGTINASWDNISIAFTDYWLNNFNQGFHPVGLYNVTFFANDTLGRINNTEKSNFTVVDINNAPSTPFILTPYPDAAISGTYNITWSSVSDADFDALRFNITLLNSDLSDNASIISDYGNNSSTNYEWDTTAYPDGEYSLRVTVYENETAEGLENSYEIGGTFFINNNLPNVTIISPLGETYPDGRPVSISITAYDSNGINSSIAQITNPNSSMFNLTLGLGQQSDNFSTDTIGVNWMDEDTLTGPSQICIADIDTSVLGKAYTSLSGDGSPESDTLCSLISTKAIDGDFNITIDFNIENSTNQDYALNFQITEIDSSADASRLIFMALSNWTGQGQQYEIFADDGNYSDYILQRETNDTSGRFMMSRTGNNFTFYTWDSTNSSWNSENVSENNFNFSRAVYVSFESESAYSGWGTMEVTWDNFTVQDEGNLFNLFKNTYSLGLYNVTIFVTDNLGGLNDSEKTNFTIAFNNDPPSKPYILTPFNGAVISGLYNISGSNVNDEENDSLRINITLLNPDYSPNATIVSDYGNSSVTSYEWNTTAYPDGVYSLEVVFYENETAEGLSNSDILEGNFTIDNTPPLISFEPPTDPSGSTISNRDYIIINVTASDLTLNLIEVNIYNSSLDLINTTYHSSSPVYMNSSMLSPGLYYFNATAIDLANHSNSTETRNVTIAESSCMEISSPGDYGIFANIDGAPISGSPVSGTACVKISSSNVSLNCNGFNITNNGTAGTTYGIELNGSLTNVSVINCTIANYSIGIAVFNSSNGLLQNNTLRYNGIGIQIDPSYNNTVIQNNIYNNSQYGIYLLDSFNNSLLNNTAYNNSYGFLIEDSSNNSLTNNTAYNNGYDLYMNSSIAGAYLNVSRMSFLNPLGSIANYTVLSLNDTLDQNSAYYVNWTTNSTPTPLYRDSFEQKFVNISTDAGNVSIDSIVWHWLTSELSGYNESRFEIWKYNGSWSGSGSTLNAGANTLSLANLSPESTFGILQNNVPLAILNVTDSPDPEGYGLNVTILANITGADTILVGVTPPGGNETNYTMTNATPNIYTYDYSNWTNSTYYYIIYANDTNGIWYNSSTYNFTLAQNLTIQLKTLEDYYSTNQTINITDPPSAGSGPNIISASVNPEKVVPGDRMAITVYVSDPYGIESVQAVMPHELGNDTLILNQTSGSEFNGIWEGIWTVHDTIAKEYVSTIIAQNKNAETSTSYVTWFDPPGIWISPSSFTDPSGQWTNEANAMDGDTDTYASDNSNPGTGWGQFIIFNTTQIQSDSVRVWADYGPQVGSVDVDIYRDGGWINVHEGPVTNLKWYEINFTEGNLSAARFRYNYTVGGWIYWLYEMQFYNVSTQVNIPVAATRAATSVEETSGILHGVVNADGGTDCQLRFIYGTNESYGLSTPWTGPFYTGDSYGYWLTSLTNGQTYHFKVQINNSAGLANGSQKQFTAGPAGVGWLSPSNYSDPNGEWVNELYIMDDELSTEAESYHDANDPDGVWSFYLHLNRTPVILSDKIRFNAKAIDTDLAEVDIYTNGSWVNVFNGAFADKTYIVASYNMTNVSEARIRLRADSNTKGFFWQVYEFDFYKNILTALENQSRLDNNGTTNASCYLQMETQFWNGSSWIDDDLVVNDSSPRVLAPEDVLKLDLIWNPYNYSSNNLSYGEGIYRVYASCVDDVGNLLTNVNGSFVNASYNFTFDGTPPLVNITSPENNSNYTLTSTVPIHANVTDDVGVVLVQANVSNSLGYEIVTLSYNVTSGLWEYDFTNTVFVDTYTIQIIATDTSGNVNDTEWVVFNVLDITAPNVTLVSPSDNNYTESGAVTFTCNVTDNYDVSNVSLYITDENNQSFAFNQSDTVSGVSVSVDFNLTLPTGDYTWNCLAYDSSNNSDWGDANYSLRVVDLTSCPIIPFPGTYSQPINYVGAPNNATPLSDFVCVKITSSDVIYDCNGYNITDNGTAGTTYGVLLNGSLTNVTLQNCGISNYTNGIYVYQSNDSNITNHTSYSNNNGIVLDGSDNNYLADISSSDNSGYGMLLNSSTNNTVIDSNLTNNTLDGISIIEFNYNKITNLTSCHNGQNGIALHDVDFTTIDAAISCNNSMHGILLNISGDINITQSESYNNSDYGVYLYDSRRLNMTDSNSTNNTIGGIYFDNQSVSNSFSSDYICFNGFDINNQGSTNAGSLDTCDTFASWSENGHLGCEFACSSFWHRFFGDLNSSIVLTDAAATNNVHTWNASGFMVYFADYDSSIDWASLQALGRTSTSTQSANDFTELDTAFNGTTYDDNINATYSTDGSLPIETRSYTVFQNTIANVPVANSTKQNTTFQTGILWDTNDGGTEYSNTLNQSTVWVVEVNASTVDAYGTYDYLISVPYTLSTYETNTDLVSVYIELQ